MAARRVSTFFGGSSNHDGEKRSASPGKHVLQTRATDLSTHDKVRSSSPNKLNKRSTERAPSVGRTPAVCYSRPLSTKGSQKSDSSIQQIDDVPLPMPPSFTGDAQLTASPTGSRPATPILSRPSTPKTNSRRQATLGAPEGAEKKRKSWFGSKNKDKRQSSDGPLAWVIGHDGKLPYDLSPLLNAERIPELWDDQADTLVYLFPRSSGKGPSFRVDSSIYACSPALTRMVHGNIYSSAAVITGDRRIPSLELKTQKLSLDGYDGSSEPSIHDHDSSEGSKGSRALTDPLETGPRETRLYLPLFANADDSARNASEPEPRFSKDDIHLLVSARNLFAFLVGQSLVATESRSGTFAIFMNISEMLRRYQFTNLDGSTYGEIAASSFDSYVEELQLADVRASREKTVEAIVLGERMRSIMLYNEGFVHGVGKYDEIAKLRSPKFTLISPTTQNRLERASMDLETRLKNLTDRLVDFEFPSIFAGIMNSKTYDGRKMINFDQWKTSFLATRKHILGHYKHAYGAWPPKASSKKNNLETSGINRLVLKDIYRDFTQLYDLLVDRTSLTTRSADSAASDEVETDEPTLRALRGVLGEYDRSIPPFQPPIPFDAPLLPTLATTRPDFGRGDARKDAKLRGKKLKDAEINDVLQAAYNRDATASPSPFLTSFYELERRAAHHRTLDDLINLRAGQWIFVYAVLQALPMLVVDAPGTHCTDGVEYFLCQPPRSGVPWARADSTADTGAGNAGSGRAWYGVAGGAGVVSLPSDVVEHGVEGVFRRSHCWARATEWTAGNPLLAAAVAPSNLDDPLPPPPTGLVDDGFDMGGFGGGGGGGGGGAGSYSAPGSPVMRGSRASSPSRGSNVVALGLDKLPLPAGVAPVRSQRQASRPQSATDPTKTFDAILGTAGAGAEAGKGGKKRK